LKLQLQLLRRGVKPDQGVAPAAGQLAKALDASTVQVDRLTRLINDMLDISRMQSGELSVLPEPMNLAELVREVVERLTPDLTSARCPITVEVDPDLRIKADRARLEQVIVNLVSNAIKYAAGTAISVRVHQNDIGTQIDVSDEGPGIAPDKQSVIFECFERGAATRNVAGLGLGLYICRRLVEAHGGTISVDSAIARGATFHIALPRELTVTRAEGLRESA
jgi:signal transduction histidine kinase